MAKNSFWDFQANVGKTYASVGLVAAWIFGIFLVLVAIGVAVTAFIPMEMEVCDRDENCEKDDRKKTHPWLLLVSLALVLFATLVIWLSTWWKGEVKRSKTAAQIAGTIAEINLAKNILGNSN